MTRRAKEDAHITSYWREAKTEGSPIGRSGLKTVHSWPVLSHTPFPCLGKWEWECEEFWPTWGEERREMRYLLGVVQRGHH